MRTLTAILILLAGASVSCAQTVTITGQVKDTNGTAYSGGSGVFTLVPQNVQWTVNQTNPVQSPITIAQLDSTGHFSVVLTNTSIIDQQSSNPEWQASFCSTQYENPTTKYCFTMNPLALTSNQDITATITPQAALLPINSLLTFLGLNNTWTGFNTWTQQLTIPTPAGCALPQLALGVDTHINSNCAEPSNVTGNAATATALAALPSGCTLPLVSTGILANGNANCSEPSNITGNAPTASALASSPTTCTAGMSSIGILANGNATGCFAPVGIQAYNNCPMSGDLTVTTTVVRSVVACVVTMPSQGCPCRLQYNWSVGVTVNNNNHIAFWVTDGTNNFRWSPAFGQTSDFTGSSGSGTTSATYSNNSVVTLTLETQGLGSPNYTVQAAPSVGAGANSGMDVSAVTSN